MMSFALISSAAAFSVSRRDALLTTSLVGVLPDFEDTVVRVIDGTTIKFEKMGVVKLVGVREPDRFPACFNRAPDARTRILLPRNARCRLVPRQRSVEVFKSGESVNERLVREGYLLASSSRSAYVDAEAAARQQKKGIWIECPPEPQFVERPLQELQSDPGDTKNCVDFETYEDAKRYYDRYWAQFGDVARLDRDNNGVPCPSLPHTTDSALFQFKKPRKS